MGSNPRDRFEERRQERTKRDRMAKKDMRKYLEKVKARYEEFILRVEKDLELFDSKGLNVGDFAFHKDYGNCLIIDINQRVGRRLENLAEWDALVQSIHGEAKVDYSELLTPTAATKVLFDEKG